MTAGRPYISSAHLLIRFADVGLLNSFKFARTVNKKCNKYINIDMKNGITQQMNKPIHTQRIDIDIYICMYTDGPLNPKP